MKCLVFDRGDGVLGIGLKILFGGIDQFCIAWPDRPPERMTHDFLLSNGVSILAEGEVIIPIRESAEDVESMSVEPAEKLVEIDMDASVSAGELVPVDPALVAPTLVDPPTPVIEPIAPVVEPTAPISEPIAPVSEPQPVPTVEPAPTVETPIEQLAPVAESTVSAIELV